VWDHIAADDAAGDALGHRNKPAMRADAARDLVNEALDLAGADSDNACAVVVFL